MIKVFSGSDLGRIEFNTNRNSHGENLVFIAKKIKSSLLKDLEESLRVQYRRGYLDSVGSNYRYELYLKLMDELKKKYPDEYQGVYERL